MALALSRIKTDEKAYSAKILMIQTLLFQFNIDRKGVTD